MAKFVQKLEVVEAMRFDGTPAGANRVFESFDIPRAKFVPGGDLAFGSIVISPTIFYPIKQVCFRGYWVVQKSDGNFEFIDDEKFHRQYEQMDMRGGQ